MRLMVVLYFLYTPLLFSVTSSTITSSYGTTQQFTMEEVEARERVTASHQHRTKASQLDCWLAESQHFPFFA
jgi:hypothetical protein